MQRINNGPIPSGLHDRFLPGTAAASTASNGAAISPANRHARGPASSPSSSIPRPPTSPTTASVHVNPRLGRHPLSQPGQPSAPSDQTPTRRRPLSASIFPLFFAAAAGPSSSASIAPSTAEVKPTPLDGGTAALRELNANYPSNLYRHRSAKSSGAQSTTYSQPVIVRTYSGPPPAGDHYPRSGSRPLTRRTPLPPQSAGANGVAPAGAHGPANGSTNPSEGNGTEHKTNGAVNNLWTSGNFKRPNMPRHPPPQQSKKRRFPLVLPWNWGSSSGGDPASQSGETAPPPPKYPPLEAFTMKGILQAQRGQPGELDACLDQIAELYARSRYSLSNQYEVHVTPHGSGTDFIHQQVQITSGRRKAGSSSGSQTGRRRQQLIGPTLQATWSGDEGDESSVAGGPSSSVAPQRPHRKRRSGGPKRKSAAYGTLETIMSSSRSNSSDDREEKKSAAKLTEGVRGRAERHHHHRPDGKTTESINETAKQQSASRKEAKGKQPDRQSAQEDVALHDVVQRKRASSSFVHAIISDPRHDPAADPPRTSGSALVSEPAMPQTTRVEPRPDGLAEESQSPTAEAGGHGIGGWIPWRGSNGSGAQPARPSRASAGLRDLLRGVDSGSKAAKASVDRAG